MTQERARHERVEPKRMEPEPTAQKREARETAERETGRGGLGQGGAYVITGPTSGIGQRTALELAAHGTVVLVGRDPGKLDEVQRAIEGGGGKAVTVVCDLSDLASRPARGGGDRRARAAARGAGQQRRHQSDAAHQECLRAGTRCSPRIISARSR